MKNDKLLEESFDFIGNNLNILSNDVPQHLINFWATDNIFNEDLEATNQWSVFMYALGKQKLEKGMSEFTMTPRELIEMFENWQITLAAITVNNLTDVTIKPFKLFDFDNFKNLKLQMYRP